MRIISFLLRFQNSPNSLAKQTHRRYQTWQLKSFGLSLLRPFLLNGFDGISDGAKFLGAGGLVGNVEAVKTVVWWGARKRWTFRSVTRIVEPTYFGERFSKVIWQLIHPLGEHHLLIYTCRDLQGYSHVQAYASYQWYHPYRWSALWIRLFNGIRLDTVTVSNRDSLPGASISLRSTPNWWPTAALSYTKLSLVRTGVDSGGVDTRLMGCIYRMLKVEMKERGRGAKKKLLLMEKKSLHRSLHGSGFQRPCIPQRH